MSTGKIELSVGATKIANKYEIFTEEQVDAINNKIPELDGRVGVIEDEIEGINNITNKIPELDERVGVIEDEIDTINNETEEIKWSLDTKANEEEVRKKNVLITSGDISQELKESISGGSVAVVGRNSVNYDTLSSDIAYVVGDFCLLDVVIENGFRDTHNGVFRSNSGFKSFIMPCYEGQTFFITTEVSTDTIAICNFYNDDTLISYVGRGQLGTYTDYKVVVPSGVNKISVTSKSTTIPTIKGNKIIDISIKELNNKLTNSLYSKMFVKLDLDILNGYYDTTMSNNTFKTHTGFYTIKTLCNEGETFKATMKVSTGTLAKVIFWSEGDEKLSYIDKGTLGTFEDFEFTIPSGAKYVSITSEKKVVPVLKKKESVNRIDRLYSTKADNEIIDSLNENIGSLKTELSFEFGNAYSRMLRDEKANEFEFKQADKVYFAFVIDDCNSFLPLALKTFKVNNVPLSSATIYSKMNTTYNSVTVKDTLIDLVENGGEVLAHYVGSLTNDNTNEEWLKITRTVKKNLESEGFEVRGIIRADSTVKNSTKGDKYARMYFDYSDGLGKGIQYDLRRKMFIGVNTLDDMKSYIDTCCKTNGFYPFCFHGNRDDEPLATQENLQLIIDYIKSKGDNVEFTTYRDYYDKFKSTNLENRLIALEGN